MVNDLSGNRVFGTQDRTPNRKSNQRAASSLAGASDKSQSKASPTRDQIAKKAYEIWLSKGCEHGHDQEHWIEAERQLRQKA